MDLGSDADLFKWEKEADALEEDEAEVKDFGEDAEAEAINNNDFSTFEIFRLRFSSEKSLILTQIAVKKLTETVFRCVLASL